MIIVNNLRFLCAFFAPCWNYWFCRLRSGIPWSTRLWDFCAKLLTKQKHIELDGSQMNGPLMTWSKGKKNSCALMKIATRQRLRTCNTRGAQCWTPCALVYLSRHLIASWIRNYLHTTSYFVLGWRELFSTILSMKTYLSIQVLFFICRRDSMVLGMPITYRLPYSCQHGRLIKDFFTAKNPASSD